MSTQNPDLRTAAQAVIDRWETPLWKDTPATAEYIGRLRAALAAGQATASQQGVAYAELPEPLFQRPSKENTLVWVADPISSTGVRGMFVDSIKCLWWWKAGLIFRKESDAAALALRMRHALRASHGQAPAQAAPAAVVEPSDAVAYLDIGTGGYLDLGTDLANEALSRLPKGRHALVIAGTYGIDGYTAAPTTQPAPGEQNESAYQRGYMDGMAKGRRDVEAAPQQEAQGPCSTCAALARTVMLDQVSFDRKPDCYGIRQITDDEGVEEWEDIRTSPDVAREEANCMMATGRGEIYEVVPLWTTPQPEPQPSPAAQGDALSQAASDVLAERQRQISAEGWTPEHDDEHVNDEIAAMACYYVMPPGAREWSGPDEYVATLGEAIRPDGWDAKDCDRRRELVKGAALALAELERIDRADAARAAQEGK